MEREKLGSRLGFILLSAGCAIGCGNVWKFPWMCGQYGGGGFVLLYFFCLLLQIHEPGPQEPPLGGPGPHGALQGPCLPHPVCLPGYRGLLP